MVVLFEDGLNYYLYSDISESACSQYEQALFLLSKLNPMNHKITIRSKKILADTFTPVSVYLKLRDKFPNSILLESSDYRGNENSFSFIACKPIAGIKAEKEILTKIYPGGSTITQRIDSNLSVTDELTDFIQSFKFNESYDSMIPSVHGLFGYTSYDAVRYFEEIEIGKTKTVGKNIPDLHYNLYQFVIAIDHFKNEAVIYQYSFGETACELDVIEGLIKSRNYATYKFKTKDAERSNFSDEDFIDVIKKGKLHCKQGDVFQLVLSREFSRNYLGDDFNVYRALRTVNPSPYLFYFDYGNFKLFGSSPEAQLVIKKNSASIYPIAGTFKRSGNEMEDFDRAEALKLDQKENAEHMMLVDLARNDLSRSCGDVRVEKFREVQFYSHVIHMVSKVSGKPKKDTPAVKLMAQTFPAGTLSGAPKHKAMQLIDRYEKGNRSFYGGCIGFLGFDGTFNSAIMIRSFLAKDNCLFYQAGAGVVDGSNEQSELQEVNNKLAALKHAIELAKEL